MADKVTTVPTSSSLQKSWADTSKVSPRQPADLRAEGVGTPGLEGGNPGRRATLTCRPLSHVRQRTRP